MEQIPLAGMSKINALPPWQSQPFQYFRLECPHLGPALEVDL